MTNYIITTNVCACAAGMQDMGPDAWACYWAGMGAAVGLGAVGWAIKLLRGTTRIGSGTGFGDAD